MVWTFFIKARSKEKKYKRFVFLVISVELVYYVRTELDVDVGPTERARLDSNTMGSPSADLVGSVSRRPGTSVVRSSFSYIVSSFNRFGKCSKRTLKHKKKNKSFFKKHDLLSFSSVEVFSLERRS